MNSKRIIAVFLCLVWCGPALAQAQEMDKELSSLADKLTTLIKERGNKKVTVLDFTDLEGATTELGKYIAEQLTVDLVIGKRDFSVLDRANLRRILAEHKLTATGLVDPENAKKLGKFAGVDAIILGTIIPKNQNVSLTAKIITTETAEIVGAAKAEFKSDQLVQQFLAKPAGETKVPDDEKKEGPSVVKSFGDAQVELQPLRIVNGTEYLLTMTITNRNAKKSIWVALNADTRYFPMSLKATITDSGGSEFLPDMNSVSGIAVDPFQAPYMTRATEIKPGESITPTVKFFSVARKEPASGTCSLQLEFLISNNFGGNSGTGRLQNIVTKIEAN